jgi:hypothetical protein
VKNNYGIPQGPTVQLSISLKIMIQLAIVNFHV